MRVLYYQSMAEMKRAFRNPYYVFWSLCIPVIFYFVFTNVINVGVSDGELWASHYLMSMTTFSVMGSSIMSLGIRMVQEKSTGWIKFIKVTPLSNATYLLSQMIGQSCIHLLSIIVIFFAGFVINGVSLTAMQWIISGLWIIIGSFAFLTLGTLIGTMKKVDTANGVSNILFLALALIGGMWMPLDTMPKWLQAIAEWLPSYNFVNGPWEIIRGNTPHWGNMLILFFFTGLFMILSTYIRRRQEVV
ncbi:MULTISPECIES: ABC transporter permease [unclassified Virgibacillus]|uniref:ABC transporter permease n=1 Tax=unclassified Virgibacillus TaxID=2620237 RepID=UPI000EF5419A|nr:MULTISPECIES: ABC transporter permease [unclassified Virgibacillus]MDY7045868.1 ABC transporter permease [Virgibacillus sp. M23]